MTIQLRFAAASDVGLVRKNNQDSGYASQTLFAVADGMGGAAAGDLASTVAIAHLAAADGDFAPDELLPRLRNALNTAHAELTVRTEENPQLSGMGTTCVAFMRSGNKLAMAHIGDSRAYLLRGGKLTQITHDHTLVQYLVDTGQITAEQAKNHPKRNVIMRALSDDMGETEIALDESIREAVPKDRWLLCSDGLYGPVPLELIHSTLADIADLEECAQTLIGHALAGGAPDNVTVVIVDIVNTTDENEIPAEFATPQLVGAAATRKITIRSAQELAAAAAARANLSNSQLGDGKSGKIGGTALVNAPDNLSEHGTLTATAFGSGSADIRLMPVKSPQAARLALGANKNSTAEATTPQSENLEVRSELPELTALNADAQTQVAPRKRHRGAKIAAIFGLLTLIAAGAFGVYSWSQTKYYVAPADGYIGIYRGVPTELGPIKLSHLEERSNTRISDLSDFVQTRLETPITRDSLDEARAVVNSLSIHQKAALK